MIDRELLQQALDALSMAVEPKKNKVYALEFQPIDCEAMHIKAIEALRARLAQPPKDLELPLVRPAEFVKLIQGKENYWGIPVMRTEWPMPELVIQAREEGDLIVADLPQVPTGGGGISKDEQPKPILPGGGIGRHPESWVKTYSGGKPNYTQPDIPNNMPIEWVDLTAAEVRILRNASNTDREFAALVIAKFKEKNT